MDAIITRSRANVQCPWPLEAVKGALVGAERVQHCRWPDEAKATIPRHQVADLVRSRLGDRWCGSAQAGQRRASARESLPRLIASLNGDADGHTGSG
jgi:hypothetical protein